MCTKTDSEATYCSEVENMLTACNIPLRKSSNNLPLRRSQRLSQKLQKVAENITNIAPEPVPARSGVPLDLSHKFKEFTRQTPRLEIDEPTTRENALDVVEINEKEFVRSEMLYNTNSKRPGNKIIKKEPPKTQRNMKGNSYSNQSQQQHNYFSNKDVTKTLNTSLKKQGTNNTCRSRKVDNLKNNLPETNLLGLAVISKLNFPQNDKLEEKTLFSNECSTNKVAHSKKHGSRKTNKNTFVKPSCQTIASMIPTERFEDSKLSEALKYKPIEINLFEKHSNDIKPSKRNRKRKQEFGEMVSKSKPESDKKQNAYENYIKIPAETNDKTQNLDAEFNIKNTPQTKNAENNKKLDKRQHIYPATKKTRSQQIPTNSNLENEHKKIKTEKLYQKFCEEAIQTNNCLQKIPPAIPNLVYSQFMENKLSTIEVAHESQDVKPYKKLSKETNNINTNLNPLQKVELTTENLPSKNQTKNSILNKNYIKSFDKNQFLDKIRNVRSYVDHLSTENNNLTKINTFEIPPSPIESSEELLRKSILFNTYPAHFKYQLPPEAILTQSLDPQPLPTPDDTISSELLESSSSSPSLPESLCQLFKTKDIKDILNLKQTSYHLNSYHIQALALILNIQIEYLVKILDKVINTSPEVLKNIEKAVKTPFTPDNDLFSNSSNELWNSSNAVPNSQSPKQRKISCRAK